MLVLFATSAADFKELEEKSGKLHKIGAEKPYTGKVEIYDSSKNRIGVFSSVDGVKSGPYFQFFKDGRKKIEGQYEAGLKHGSEHEYNEKNVLIYKREFSNGTVKSITANYDSGEIKYEKEYSGDRRREYYYEEGESHWKTSKTFYNNKLAEESERRRVLIGRYGINEGYTRTKYYEKNEKLTKTCDYNGVDGSRMYCKTYCSDGRIHEEISYFDKGLTAIPSLRNYC